MSEKLLRLLSTITIIITFINLGIIFSILYVNSYKPILIEQIAFLSVILLMLLAIFSLVYKLILILFFYKKIEHEKLIEMNSFYMLILGWFFTLIILLILIKIYYLA